MINKCQRPISRTLSVGTACPAKRGPSEKSMLSYIPTPVSEVKIYVVIVLFIVFSGVDLLR